MKATRGPNFYEEIGHKGGQKVKRLIEEGKRAALAATQAAAAKEASEAEAKAKAEVVEEEPKKAE